MRTFRTSTFHRRLLLADAATCAADGLLLLALGAGRLERRFGLPAAGLTPRL